MRVGNEVQSDLNKTLRDIILTINSISPIMKITTGQIITRQVDGEIPTMSTVLNQSFLEDEDENENSYFSELQRKVEDI